MAQSPNQKRSIRPFRSSLALRTNDNVARVFHIPGFLKPEECQRIANSVTAYSPAVAEVGGTQQGVKETVRKSDVWVVYPDASSDWLYNRLETALSQLNQRYGFDLLGFYEGAQVARYRPGGHYDWHMDVGEGVFAARKLSLSVQLSPPESYQGGELEFQVMDGQESRDQGTLIAFPSFLTHRVRPVTEGERFSLVTWISGRPFR